MPETDEEQQLLRELSLGALANRCARETQRFFRRESYDSRFCFEIFRRAAEDSDQRAWELVYEQYHALVHGWILRHPGFEQTGEEPLHYLNLAFERLWSALRGNQIERFGSLASILSYLRRCVSTALIDDLRRRRLEQVGLESAKTAVAKGDGGGNPERVYEEQNERKILWGYVQECVRDDQERAVIHGIFVLALKPSQVFAKHPELFGSVEDVYRVRQNVMSRFRRDQRMQEFIRSDA